MEIVFSFQKYSKLQRAFRQNTTKLKLIYIVFIVYDYSIEQYYSFTSMISVIYSYIITIRQLFNGITLYCFFSLNTYFIKQLHFHYDFPNYRFMMRFGQQVYVPSITIVRVDQILRTLLGLSLVFNQPLRPSTNY